MGALADILLSSTSAIVALCLVALATADAMIVEYSRRRFNRMENRLDDRLGRVEDALIASDGGDRECYPKGSRAENGLSGGREPEDRRNSGE